MCRSLLAILLGLAVSAPLSAPAATLTWVGGSGNWDTTSPNWSGTTWSNLVPDSAVFAGAAGTVTLTENISSGTITATTTGYTLGSSGASALTVSRIDISSLGDNGQLNLGAKLTGTGPLALAGAGNTSDTGGGNANIGIRLTNAGNDFVGDVTITDRLVSYTADSVFGNAANKIIMNGGGLLDNNVSVNLARDIEVRGGGGIIRFWNSSNATWSGALSGTGTIRRTDTGTLTLSGNLATFSGTYSQVGAAAVATVITGGGTVGGNWTATAGTITFNSASNQAAAGSFSGSFAKSGAGTLTLSNATVGGNWTVNTGGGLVIQSASAQAMGGLVSGAGNLTKLGAGTLTMTARSTISGTITAGAGTLQLNDARSMNGPAYVGSGATMTIENNANGGYYQPSLLDVTTATVNSVVTSANRYHGIYTEVVNAHGGASAISLPLYMNKLGDTNPHTLTFTVDPGASLSVSGAIANHPDVTTGGALAKAGGGTLTLSGASTFKGNVTIASGTLVDNLSANNTNPTATALGDMTIAGKTVTTSTGATLVFQASDTMGDFAYKTPVTFIADGGTITRQSTPTQYFNSFGDLVLRNGGRLTSDTGGSAAVQSFSINGSVTVSGTSGSFIDTVGSSNNGIHLNSNRAGSSSSTGTTTFDVAATGDPTADLTVSAPLVNGISYNGVTITLATSTVLKAGAGTMRVSSANAYSGGTILRAGSIVAANGGALGSSGTVTINDAGTAGATRLAIDATSGNVTIARPITVANLGTGTATLGSASTGGVNQAVFSGAVTLQKDVTLDGGSVGDRLAFTGGIGGTGNVGVVGTTRVVFSGAANSYAGATTISATSTLQLSDGTATATSFLPDGQVVVVNGILNFAKGGNAETIGGLSGSGIVRELQASSPTLVVDGGQSRVFSGTIADGGGTMAFTKSGAGTQVLTGANTYSGATTITGGTLQIGNGGTTGSIVTGATVSAGAALAFSRSDAVTYSGTVSGAGSLVQQGSGTLTLTANNTFSGNTTLAGGVLSLGSANAIGTTGTISFTGGTLQSTASNTTDYSSRFSTAAGQAFRIDTNGQAVALGSALTSAGGTLTKLGSGTLALTANNTYSGATTVAAGVLQIGNGGGTGSVAGSIANSGTVVFNRTGALSVDGIISGSGALVQAGSGTTTLSGFNTYTAATTITGGALSISADSNLGAVPGTATPGSIVIDGGRLTITSGSLSANRGISLGPSSGAGIGTINVATGLTVDYGGAIANNGAGTGGLVKVGEGTLRLSGAAAYAGDTAVDAGTLQLGSGVTLASPLVTVASGAALGGRGTAGAVTVASGGILAPGIAGSGTLTTGSLTFSGLATLTMAAVSGTAPSNLLAVLGDVTTSGGTGSVTFSFPGTSLTNIATGTYSLLTYSGVLSNTSAFLVTGNTGGRQTVAISNTAAAKTVSLVVGNASVIWTGTDGTGWFAAGNWNLSSTGTAVDFETNDTVLFTDAATSGTAVISGSNATPASVTFAGDTKDITVAGAGGFGISTGAIIKTGSALVTLASANTYGGGTTLSAGRLRVGDDGALGSGTISFFGPAALSSDSAAARSLANGLHLDADVTLGDATDTGALTISGTVTFDGGVHAITTLSNVTLSGPVTNGGLTKSGSGVLALTGSNTYGGGTTLSAGTLRVGTDTALGTAGVVLDGGALSSTDTTARTLTNGFTLGGDVTLGDATNTGALALGSIGGIDLGGATRRVTTPSTVTFAGIVTNGGLAKLGAGTLTLAAANSYSGGTTLSAGAIALGNVGGLGSGGLTVAGNGTIRTALTGTIANAISVDPAVTATLEATSGRATYSGVISGSGAIATSGPGTVVLTATNSYSGDTTIAAGTLELGGAGLLGGGSYSGAITNSGTLSITSSAVQTLSGAIANARTIAVNSSGNQTLSGVISGVGSLTKAGAGTLTLSNASNSYSGGSTITGGTVAFVSGALGSSGNVTVSGAALRWATGNTQDISPRLVLVNAATATLDVGTNDVTLASGLGAGTSAAVTKTGAGTLTLSGSNGYTGPTTVSGGTLQIGADGSTGSVGGDIANAGTLAFNRSDAVTYAGLVSGAGAVRQVGSGTLTLSGNNTFSGQLTVARGAVAVATINNAGANGPLGNSASSVVLGSSGASGLLAYTGATASSTKRFTLATGGTGAIAVPAATTLTLSGSIDGSGGFVKQGPGTLSLTGASPFTGNMTIASGTVNVNLTANSTSPTATALGNMTTGGRTVTVSPGATLNFVLADAIGDYTYKTPVTLIADGGTIFRSSSGGNYFNSLGDVELRNGGRLTTNNGNIASVQSYGLNGNVTVSGTSGSFIDTVGSSFNGINLGNNVSYGGSTTFTVNATGDPTADLSVSVALADRTLGGASSVVKAGAGRMLLTAPSTYSGNTTISAGTLAVGPGGQIYNGGYRSSVVTVGSGATLDLQNWQYNETGTASLGGLAASASSINVNGGTIRISGATPTSYGRGVTVNSGGATLDAATGATWTIDTTNDSNPWVFSGNPSITLTGGGTGTFQKVLGNGTGGLAKSGSGTWTLTGVNTFSGNTTIAAGTLVLGGGGQLGGGAYGGAITNDGLFQITSSANQTLSGGIANSGAITISSAANQTFSGVVSGAGSLTKSGAGTLALSNASNSFTGGVSLTGGVLSFVSGGLGSSGTVSVGNATLQWAGVTNSTDLSSRLALANSSTTTLDVGSNNVTFAAGFGGSSTASLVKTGVGTLALTGSNDFSGGTTLAQGTLSFASDGLGSGNVTMAADTVLQWAAGNSRDISSRLVLPGTGNVTLDTGTNAVTLAGGLGAGSAVGLTKVGAGRLTLSGSGGYFGATAVNEGTLAIAGAGDIASSSGIGIAPGGTLDIAGASGFVNVGTLTGSGDVTLGGNTLRTTVVGESIEFNGVISGSGGFTKAGPDSLRLTDAQTFTGTATVEAGTLVLANGTEFEQASVIAVLASGVLDTPGLTIVLDQTLAGRGTVYGPVTFAPGAVLAPGGSVGGLTNDGSTTWNGGMRYVFEVNDATGTAGGPDGWDLYNVTGDLVLAADIPTPIIIDLTSLSGTSPGFAANFDENATYRWLIADAGSEITTFDPSWFSINTADFLNLPGEPGRFSVVRGDALGFGNDQLYLTYVAIPEPATLALAGIGLAAVGWAASRRRGRNITKETKSITRGD